MKKRIIYALLLLFFPLLVYADSISFECPSKVKVGDNFSCDIYGNSSLTIEAVDFYVAVTDGLSIVGFSSESGWQGGMTDTHINMYRSDDVTSKFKIGTIKFSGVTAGTNTIVTSEAYFYDDEEEVNITDVSQQVEIVSGNASVDKDSDVNTTTTTTTTGSDDNNTSSTDESSTYLIGIIIDKYTLDFDKETFEYELTIADGDNELTIQPLLEDNNSTYDIVGNSKLKDGSIVSIMVTSNTEESRRTYNIKIHKKELKYVNKYSIVFISIIGVLVLINILRIVLRNKRKNSGG